MKKHDLTSKNAAELETLLRESQAKVAQMRFDLADKKLKKTSDLRETRRLIARILTALKRSA
ncbi:MAG: 50S ribosomal protein L29 [Candidatus Yanofskybacteria bacterium]|nr:50S ribosomal protein L29 [Candidatus Yanofskybacteria bacterium]